MLASLLIAAVAGMRAMTPLATVAQAARAGELPSDSGAPALLAHPLVAAGTLALAAGELAGDKMKTAPDRIILPGMVARVATGAFAAASLAPRRQRTLAALLGAGVAAGASYLTFRARVAAMRRYGQTATGVVEDAVALGTAALAVRAAR
ncbi:DUF4126 family protein [Sphingomonas sp. BK235]|jgi:uncharacterized membrane protein|uniref:DUF4126 family protein n=1 Tax=Sphingomonas sp. BK235 TaxID=2512131 RepID=UPI00104EB377|nr:DUF4126 family protein [Sphingomonas sp. BK235]TCP32767.1 putative membrane protein [Sphingomonas sp. BK235]